MISADEWADYQNILSGFNSVFAQKQILWKRYLNRLNAFNEDVIQSPIEVSLKVLINDNYMRTWPINQQSESGELEKQSIQVYIFLPYLKNLGYEKNNSLDYQPDYDRFIIDGKLYKPTGDTPTAQAGDKNLWVTIICRREESETGR